MTKMFFMLALAAAFAAPALAAERTVTLSVQRMVCPACPLTVKKALTRVKGVTKTDVSFETRSAVVSFDDAQTDVGALLKATADAGFPSTVKQ